MYDATDRYSFELEQANLLEEIQRLKKENMKLKDENETLYEILKFFVRHS